MTTGRFLIEGHPVRMFRVTYNELYVDMFSWSNAIGLWLELKKDPDAWTAVDCVLCYN